MAIVVSLSPTPVTRPGALPVITIDSITTPVAYAAGIVATHVRPATAVTYQGELYVCTVAHTTTDIFDPAKWLKIVSKGADSVLGPAVLYAALPIMRHEALQALIASTISGVNLYDAYASWLPAAEKDLKNARFMAPLWPVGAQVWTDIQTALTAAVPGGFSSAQIAALQDQALAFRSNP